MCGVVGSINIEFTESLLRSLQHRGPDDHGFETIMCSSQSVRLGHTRLAILDISSAGHQPMQSLDGRWWVTYNGEIYNHLNIRKLISNVLFRGHSDSETLVEIIANQGIKKVLPLLNGMFAFAALDVQENKLYLIRDPFGIKPLYYYKDQNKLAFSSEVRALTAMGLSGEVDINGLRQFLSLRYTPSKMTVWKNIKRLPPGHFICFDLQSGELEISRYIKPINNRFLGNMDDAIDNYHNMLLSAIKRQLISDVPIGLLLSGGIDSALVAALAKEMDVELPCFTVGFGSKHNECEIDNAADTANFLGLPFNKIQVNSEDLKNSLSEIAKTIEEPLGTTSVMPMWHLVQRARENVTVVLTGQGSDEPWGGYFRYQVELLRNRIPWTFLWRISKNLSSAWPWKSDAFIRGLGTLSKQDPINQIMEACSLFSSDDRSLLLGDTDDGGASLQIRNWIEWLSCISDLSSVERMMRLDTRMNLGDDLLLYGDKISMAVSLETRVPMLDIELVNFIESLPINYKIGWGSGKLVHKMMAEKYLPHEIVHRPKKGFQVPFSEWSRGIWRSWIEELLFDGLNGILKKEGIEYLWKQHLEKRPDRSRQIFALIMLSLWHREHICNK